MSGRRRGLNHSHRHRGLSNRTQRSETMARKRQEHIVRQAHRKEKQMESYLADDDNFGSFEVQMNKMGMQLRDIPGDGNCLFRALGDQFQGHGRDHYRYRLEVVKYMQEHRHDFEPFVEDDVPFERHINALKKMGTYAGNDAIVAFAKLYGVNIVIHQLNSPMWTIRGSDGPNNIELHISYHNGDHYSSVRKLSDNTESPANISIKKDKIPSGDGNGATTFKKHGYHSGAASAHYHMPYHGTPSQGWSNYESQTSQNDDNDSDYENVPPRDYPGAQEESNDSMGTVRVYRGHSDIVTQVMIASGCRDRELVEQILEEQGFNVDEAIAILFSCSAANSEGMSLSSQYVSDSDAWSDTGTHIFTPENGAAHGTLYTSSSAASNGAKPKNKPESTRERKERAKRERKLRATERHRQRLLGDNYHEEDAKTAQVTNGFGMLHI